MPEGRGKMNHGNMSYDDKPSFYKIIFDDQAKKARIPYGFMKHIPNEELGTATLESSSGRRWSVELRRKKDGLFITDGWQEFIRDNSLVNYELVLFTYDGKKHFSVQIFDPSGLEKASAPLIASMYQEAASSSKIKRKRGRPRKSTVSPFNLRRPKPRDGASDEHQQSREPKKNKRSTKKKSTRKKIKLGELDAASQKANSRLKELGKRNTKSDARTVKEDLPVHEEVMEFVQACVQPSNALDARNVIFIGQRNV